MKWIIRSLTVIALGGLTASAGYWAGAQKSSEPKKPIKTLEVNQIARVGNEIVTAEEFIETLCVAERLTNPSARRAGPVLDSLVAEKLLKLEAKRIEAQVKPRELDEEVETQYGAIKAQFERLNRDLAKQGQQPWKWDEFLRMRLDITDDELRSALRRKAYSDLLKRLVVGYWEKSHEHAEALIFVRRMKASAEEFHKKLKAGEDFQKLAEKFSEDRHTARTRNNPKGAGYVGFVYENDGRLPPEVDDQFWKLKDGELSEPVKTDFGWVVVKRRNTVLANKAEFFNMRTECIKSANIDDNRLQAWKNAVVGTGRYSYERRMPGWDTEANQR